MLLAAKGAIAVHHGCIFGNVEPAPGALDQPFRRPAPFADISTTEPSDGGRSKADNDEQE